MTRVLHTGRKAQQLRDIGAEAILVKAPGSKADDSRATAPTRKASARPSFNHDQKRQQRPSDLRGPTVGASLQRLSMPAPTSCHQHLKIQAISLSDYGIAGMTREITSPRPS